MYFPEPTCNWDCNRLHQKWCNGHVRRIDFLVYLRNKETIIDYYKQIQAHENSKPFHPGMVDNINIMIGDLKRSIKTRLEANKAFHAKYFVKN